MKVKRWQKNAKSLHKCFKLRKFFFVVQDIVVHLHSEQMNVYMKKILYLIACMAGLTSCAEQYSIQGTSTLSVLDGNKAYLKVLKGTKMEVFDSCEVVHGQFRFSGTLDTVCYMGALSMGGQNIMPVVVEKGDIQIRINETQLKVSGSPLNDRLYEFLDKHNQLESQINELPHMESRMLLDGISEEEIREKLTIEHSRLALQEDYMVSEFVEANFDNELGPFIFVSMASSTPQVEHIMSKASDTFKKHPVVNDFYKKLTGVDAAITSLGDSADDADEQEIDDATIQDILNGK